MSKPKIAISKIKISGDDDVHIEYSENTTQGLKDVKEDSPYKPHDDLKKVFKDLVPHICRLAEQFDKDGNTIPATYDPNNKKAYMRCCGVSVSGEDEKEAVIFTAVRYLSTGKAITINTPALHINSEDNSYPQIDELIEELKTLNIEARAFLFDGKYAPDPQGELPFDASDANGGPDTPADIEGDGSASVSKGKGGRKKKSAQPEEEQEEEN